jgi:hypothetical protein
VPHGGLLPSGFPPQAGAPHGRASVWPPIALLIALGVAVAVWRGGGPIPEAAWMPLCVAGMAAGSIGLIRDQRLAWRCIAALGALVGFIGTGAPSLVIWLMSG